MSSMRAIKEMLMTEKTEEALAVLQLLHFFTLESSTKELKEIAEDEEEKLIFRDGAFYPEPPASPESLFRIKNAKNVYVYKDSYFSVCLHSKPTTPADFYELAMAIKNKCGYYGETIDVYENSEFMHSSSAEEFGYLLHGFLCDLLSDASRAGHLQAKELLIYSAVYESDAIAANRLELKRFNCKDNIRIYLPKLFGTAQELQTLAIHLKESYHGLYYRVEKPEQAILLSNYLLKIAARLRHDEEVIFNENMKLAEEKALNQVQAQLEELKVNDATSQVLSESSLLFRESSTATSGFSTTRQSSAPDTQSDSRSESPVSDEEKSYATRSMMGF